MVRLTPWTWSVRWRWSVETAFCQLPLRAVLAARLFLTKESQLPFSIPALTNPIPIPALIQLRASELTPASATCSRHHHKPGRRSRAAALSLAADSHACADRDPSRPYLNQPSCSTAPPHSEIRRPGETPFIFGRSTFVVVCMSAHWERPSRRLVVATWKKGGLKRNSHVLPLLARSAVVLRSFDDDDLNFYYCDPRILPTTDLSERTPSNRNPS